MLALNENQNIDHSKQAKSLQINIYYGLNNFWNSKFQQHLLKYLFEQIIGCFGYIWTVSKGL